MEHLSKADEDIVYFDSIQIIQGEEDDSNDNNFNGNWHGYRIRT
jgi:hypothetical protein